MSEHDAPAAQTGAEAGMSRRVLLAGLGSAALALPVTRVAHAQPHGHSTPTPSASAGPATGSGAPLVEPEVRRAAGGELRTTLRVDYTYKDIGGYRLHVRSYEGTIPAPTLRARPGDVLRITLVNDLPPNRDNEPADATIPHHFNTTNFHFHGGHVDPGGIFDNIFRQMEPGQTYDIVIEIPDDHPRGTYWYHPHRHGGADIQIASGMVGALILEGDFDTVPEIADAVERTLVLSTVVFDEYRTVERFETVWPITAARFLAVNGQRAPTIAMRPGELQRWRLLHAGYQDDYSSSSRSMGCMSSLSTARLCRPCAVTTAS